MRWAALAWLQTLCWRSSSSPRFTSFFIRHSSQITKASTIHCKRLLSGRRREQKRTRIRPGCISSGWQNRSRHCCSLVRLGRIAGYSIQAIYEISRELKIPVFSAVAGVSVSVILVVAVGVAVYQSIDLNFFNYDNDAEYYVYVYAHTTRNTLDLVNEVERIAKQNSGTSTGITIVSPDYWPLPWYFPNFTRVGYYGRMAAASEPIIIAN